MKQCPVCKTTYTDATLSFCLADGAALADMADEQPTIVRQGGEPMRVQIPQETARTTAPPTYQQAAPSQGGSSGGLLKVLLVVFGLGILAALALAAGTLIYFRINRADQAPGANNSNVKMPATSSPTPTPDDLRDQKIANLERQLNDQKTNSRPANVPVAPPNQPGRTIARVNSPGDGFLALRTLPSSTAGSRILQIPHGATVSVGGCLGNGRAGSGRWCRANYNGYSGWVFDAYLIF